MTLNYPLCYNITNQQSKYTRKEVYPILKYIGTYTIFKESDIITGNTIIDDETAEENTFLKGKSGTEIYRYDKDNLAIYFPSNQTVNKLKENNIDFSVLNQGDTECIVLVKEEFINELHNALKFMIKGKNEQLKEHKKKLKEMKTANKLKNKSNKK